MFTRRPGIAYPSCFRIPHMGISRIDCDALIRIRDFPELEIYIGNSWACEWEVIGDEVFFA